MIIHLIAPKDQSKWHYTWHHCYKSWEHCPYKIKMWNDEDIDQLLKEDDEEFFNTLNNLPPIYKFDYVRYIILEKFGGAYFDMDIEIVDGSFLNKLNPLKMYFMEGTTSSLLENSIMISYADKKDKSFWRHLKNQCKFNVLTNLEDCTNPFNVLYHVGPNALSYFFYKNVPSTFKTVRHEILSNAQFASLTNEISFTRHYQSSNWLKDNNNNI